MCEQWSLHMHCPQLVMELKVSITVCWSLFTLLKSKLFETHILSSNSQGGCSVCLKVPPISGASWYWGWGRWGNRQAHLGWPPELHAGGHVPATHARLHQRVGTTSQARSPPTSQATTVDCACPLKYQDWGQTKKMELTYVASKTCRGLPGPDGFVCRAVQWPLKGTQRKRDK